MKRISIIGTGFVGLVSAICFAKKGYEVYASTHDQTKVDTINQGLSPFYEKDVAPMIKEAVEKGNLKAVLGREEAVLNSDISMLCVGTPSRPDGSIDLKYIESSAREIGEVLPKKDSYHLVIVRSTVVPGTTRNIVKPAVEASGNKIGEDFGLCMQPEFLREGDAIYDTLNPDRIVIGEYDKKSGDVLEDLYIDFYGKDYLENCPILRMNIESAEMVKYGNNCLLATKISFINEIANICEIIEGVDVTEVAKGVGLDFRINPMFLGAGVGFGGSCFPKDVNAIVAFAKEHDYKPSLLDAVLSINLYQAKHIVEIAKSELGGTLKGSRIAILGLAFKPGTDDMREAPSIKVINHLFEEGVTDIIAYDPYAIENTEKIFGDKIKYVNSVEECLKGANAALLVTDWDEFKALTPEIFIENMQKDSVLVDGRRIYDPKVFGEKLKFKAIGLK